MSLTHPNEPAKPKLTRLNVSISSDYTSDPRDEDWPTDDSFILAPDFSDPMSDNLSEDYQTKEVTWATGLNGNLPMRQRDKLIPRNG